MWRQRARRFIYKCVAQVCVCSSPPSLTCTQKKCPLIAAVSRHRADCREVRDQLGCCLLSYTCPPAQSETGTAFIIGWSDFGFFEIFENGHLPPINYIFITQIIKSRWFWPGERQSFHFQKSQIYIFFRKFASTVQYLGHLLKRTIAQKKIRKRRKKIHGPWSS